MALRNDLARLDAAYRAGLVRRQLGASLAVSRLFRRLTPSDILTGSPAVDRWLEQSIAISMAVRAKVYDEATDYMTEVQRLVMPGAPPPIATPDTPPTLEQIRKSLWTTGVVSARKRIDSSGDVARMPSGPSLLEQAFVARATDPETPIPQQQRALEIIDSGRRVKLQQEIDLSGDMAGAAAARHAGNASRDQVIASTQRGGRAIGWIRVTSSKPCFFCAALASRGPVYDDDSFDESDARFEGPGRHKVHDNCSCSLRQVYTRSEEEWPALSQTLEAEWKALGDETERLYGRRPTMKDWREHYSTLQMAS